MSQPAALLERARDLVRLPSFCQPPGALRYTQFTAELPDWIRPARRAAAQLRGRMNAPAVWAQVSWADILSA